MKKENLENQKFNTSMETSDWRYSAAIVGLVKYFDYLVERGYDEEYNFYKIDDDVIEYNSEEITEERYLMFVESYFESEMQHRDIEKMLQSDEFTEEQIKLINIKLDTGAAIKKVFFGTKFSKENKDGILREINEKRQYLIKETYKNRDELYKKFSNRKCLFTKKNKICRLLNYDIDLGRKSKSISFNWDFKNYRFEDESEFDFIPFAFSKSFDSFFINNNYSIKQLVNTNKLICIDENPRATLLENLKKSGNYINFDVEVISKQKIEKGKKFENKEYYETIFIRKRVIKIFEAIDDYKGIPKKYRVNENYNINVEKEVTDCIINNIKLDYLIELLLKPKQDTKTYKYPNYWYNIKTLIDINVLIYGGDKMNEKMKSACESARRVKVKINDEKKVNSYKQKLISAITFKDYGRFCEILLQLSSYSGVIFYFAYDLFSDFEENKNIAYTFINALNNESNKDNGGNKDE
ncbi:type I CRISPR-associated protein Cas8a1/Csx8 [Clostridium gasigenes]|uniref:CRISPR-associated protein Cst1 n=1 Tax=Clostridium gasigenes TaxID=94869 RepID=A0A1H0QNM8_9CLOT|nr:type I CRISPR-associated protein Cas8a1/Csx8 [Clostridium gasigenes]SDP18862.1 CRISPR-associated protein Cst1 [Clostridium gasigenes]